MDRLTRKELKTDRLQVETRHLLDYLEEHRSQVLRYGIVAAVIVAVALGIFFYTKYQRSKRQQAWGEAVRIYQVPIGSAEPGSFPSKAERDKAVLKSFSDLTARYSGSEEAIAAHYYLGSLAAEQGRLADAEKAFRVVADSNSPYACLAKLALAEIWASQGKLPEAERLLRSLMEKPTLLVSKEQAAIELARLLSPTKPAEARKLLEPLRTSDRNTVSRAALTTLQAVPAQ